MCARARTLEVLEKKIVLAMHKSFPFDIIVLVQEDFDSTKKGRIISASFSFNWNVACGVRWLGHMQEGPLYFEA